MQRLTTWADALKRDVMTLWFALKHPNTPWYARVVASAVCAYALSPIDLIPDFIPVLGYLDDLIIVPAGVWLLLRMVPQNVLINCRAESDRWVLERKAKPRSYLGLAIIVSLWALAAWAVFGVFAMQ